MILNREYIYKIESQSNPTKIYKLISHPVPSIILAYIFMVLVVLIPLNDQVSNVSINNLTYLLVYIPCVSFFCFAVFFPLSYVFLNLPRLPYNLKTTLILFIVWILFQALFHFIFMLIGIFPIPFEWIVIAFGVGVPLIYLIVWISISKHIKSGKDNNNNTLSSEPINSQQLNKLENNNHNNNNNNKPITSYELNGADIEQPPPFLNITKEFKNQGQIEIPLKEIDSNNNSLKSDNKIISKSLSESLSKSIPKSSLSNSNFLLGEQNESYELEQQQQTNNLYNEPQSNNISSVNLNGIDEEDEVDENGKSINSSVSGSQRSISENEFDLSIVPGGILSPSLSEGGGVLQNSIVLQQQQQQQQSNEQASLEKSISQNNKQQQDEQQLSNDDQFISATTPRNFGKSIKVPLFSKDSFLFKWWIVSSTMILGPMGYLIFHLFLFAFYSVTSNIIQIVLIISFQVIVFIYKLIFRLSFHRMRSNLPNIPLRVFQDGRVLFLFWLELSSHCFFSMVFPHVGSWYMILIYLTMEAITLTLQILVDTVRFRQACIRTFERTYKALYLEEYKGQLVYNILGQNGELDRSVSLELFFFNTVARALSGFAYIVFSLTIYYGPNQSFYPTIEELTEFNYFLTLLYAAASLTTALLQMYIFKRILKHIYKLNLIKKGVELWGRRPDVAFFFITNCFILPLVVLLQQNNSIYWLSNFKN